MSYRAPPPRRPGEPPLVPTSPRPGTSPGRPGFDPNRPVIAQSTPNSASQFGNHVVTMLERRGDQLVVNVLGGYVGDFAKARSGERKPDSYVVVEHGGRREKTKTVRNRVDPKWNERFNFPIRTGPVLFRVFDSDAGRDDFLGEGVLESASIAPGTTRNVIQLGQPTAQRQTVRRHHSRTPSPRPLPRSPRADAHRIKSPWVQSYQPVFYGASRTASPQHYRAPVADFRQSYERPHQPYRFNSPPPFRQPSLYGPDGETPPLAVASDPNPPPVPTYERPWGGMF